MARGRISP